MHQQDCTQGGRRRRRSCEGIVQGHSWVGVRSMGMAPFERVRHLQCGTKKALDIPQTPSSLEQGGCLEHSSRRVSLRLAILASRHQCSDATR